MALTDGFGPGPGEKQEKGEWPKQSIVVLETVSPLPQTDDILGNVQASITVLRERIAASEKQTAALRAQLAHYLEDLGKLSRGDMADAGPSRRGEQ